MTTEGKLINVIEFSRNMFGFLKPYMKSALYNYIEFPSQDSWNEIYAMGVGTGRISTVWQAVLDIDPTFQTRLTSDAYEEDNVHWERIPDPELVLLALRKVIEDRINNLNLKYN